ncbi:MAG: acetyl-CoA hydrolase/transferase C-terminal domain-containing protein [Candidatus Nanopelagicaceae bacterium]|nr:acetyl-CoA hydrolase/transferase C-terminal domain-containing protein [Candidatus Nanopelagicaceae bacterium]
MRVVSVEQLKNVLATLPPNPRIVSSGNFATPKTLLSLADECLPEFRLHMLNGQPGIPDREGITYETAFVGAGMRRHPRLNYIPTRLSLLPVLYRDHYRPDVVMLHASSPRFDTVSLGTEVNVLPSAIEAARARNGIVIAQSNVRMPYTYGDAQIYENEIDYLVEVDEPLAIKPTTTLDDISRQIGARIAALIEDNSTLQLGIGAVPDSVLAELGHRKGLRIWTEMFSDGVLDLHKGGALDDEILLTASFVFGSQELYDWLNLNRKVRMMRTERTNDPSQIARQAKMTSINGALEVDLFDQANASHVRGEIYSGFGGSTDFIVGSLHSRGGQSFMALPSWHPKANVSTIVPRLTTNVTSFQHSYVATENGIADCFGHSQNDQARNLIEKAAHPSVREELRAKAAEFGLI